MKSAEKRSSFWLLMPTSIFWLKVVVFPDWLVRLAEQPWGRHLFYRWIPIDGCTTCYFHAFVFCACLFRNHAETALPLKIPRQTCFWNVQFMVCCRKLNICERYLRCCEKSFVFVFREVQNVVNLIDLAKRFRTIVWYLIPVAIQPPPPPRRGPQGFQTMFLRHSQITRIITCRTLFRRYKVESRKFWSWIGFSVRIISLDFGHIYCAEIGVKEKRGCHSYLVQRCGTSHSIPSSS